MEITVDQACQWAMGWIQEAGETVREFLRRGEMRFETKARATDLVTVMDWEVERLLSENILDRFPGHRILGEEGIAGRPDHLDGWVWVIDPLDGTSNFVSQQRDFVISLALYHEGEGMFGIIYDVMADELVHAVRGGGAFLNGRRLETSSPGITLTDALVGLEFYIPTTELLRTGQRLLELGPRVRGIRCYGATALALAKVACGQLDAYLTPLTNPWDHAAGRILVEEAGGMVSDFAGRPLPLDRRTSVLACRPEIYGELLAFVGKLCVGGSGIPE
jgi:myo-inositol-1(or 4)-monophosphatase